MTTLRFRPIDKNGEYLTPSAIREQFSYHEESTWAHLLEGKWAAIGYAELITEDGNTYSAEDTYLPRKLVREIFSGIYEGEVREFTSDGSTIRLKYSKDSVMVLCSPDATPELFVKPSQNDTDARNEVAQKVAPKAPPAQPSTTIHRIQRRNRHPLANVIEQAVSTANSNDANRIWSELVSMAESAIRPVPLYGFAAGEGIRYKGNEYDKSGEFDVFNKKALRSYLSRHAKNSAHATTR